MAQDTIKISALPSLVEALLVADYVPVTHNGVTYKFAPYSSFVKLTGNESVGGVKTFTSSPIVPTPTTDMHVSTKKYVDDAIDGLGVGSANGVATLGSDGKVPITELPPITITDTFPVASQAAMLALVAEKGDVAVRSDENKTYILRVEPATVLANWEWLKTPTDNVLSVDGHTGAVDLSLEYAQIYDPVYPYAVNEPSFYLGVPYKSLTAANTGNTPSTSPTHWEVTGGGSGSATNVGYNFENGQFETHTIGWNIYKDAAGVLPVDGTGQAGTPTTTFTRNTTTPINGLGDGLLSKTSGASRQGEGVSYDFTIDPGQTTSPAQITFTYETPVAYQDGYLGVFLYDKTNGALIRMSVENIPATYGSISQFLTTFIPSMSTEYRLIFHVIDSTTTAWTFEVDNIQVGQKNVAVGAAIGNWIKVSPSIFITNIAGTWDTTSQIRRVGTQLELDLAYTASGGATGPISLSAFNLVTSFGWTIQSQFNANGFNVSALDNGLSFYAGTWADVFYQSGTAGAWSGSSPFTWQAGDKIIIKVSVPIAQWTSNVNMASDFTEYASNSNTADVMEDAFVPANNVLGSGGSLLPNFAVNAGIFIRFVKPSQPVQFSDAYEVEVKEPNSHWTKTTQNGFGFVNQGSYWYGIGAQALPDGTIRVSFGRASARSDMVASWGAVPTNSNLSWAAFNADGWRWRVRKVSNGNMAEVPPVVRAEYRNQIVTIAATAFKYDVKVEDTHSAYDKTTGIFTVPIAGVYAFDVSWQNSAGATGTFYYKINITSIPLCNISAGYLMSVSFNLRLSVGDIVKVYQADNPPAVQSAAVLSITRIGS